jgi:DNA mismatch endonuclease (patch repair protein)
MVDRLPPERRSENMRRIRSQNTIPELVLRTLVHKLGHRFRLHHKDLPGKPDLVFPSLRKVIFVHGCFWHQHSKCREGRIPGSRREYWLPKLTRNQERDATTRRVLKKEGWKVLVVWECQLKSRAKVNKIVSRFLAAPLSKSSRLREKGSLT